MSGYLMPFERIVIHLLVVLIGAAFLARAKKRRRSLHSGCRSLSRRRNRSPLHHDARQFAHSAGRRDALSDRRRGDVRLRRGLHGDQAQRLGILMGIELVLNGANINFIAFGSRTCATVRNWGSTAN